MSVRLMALPLRPVIKNEIHTPGTYGMKSSPTSGRGSTPGNMRNISGGKSASEQPMNTDPSNRFTSRMIA